MGVVSKSTAGTCHLSSTCSRSDTLRALLHVVSVQAPRRPADPPRAPLPAPDTRKRRVLQGLRSALTSEATGRPKSSRASREKWLCTLEAEERRAWGRERGREGRSPRSRVPEGGSPEVGPGGRGAPARPLSEPSRDFRLGDGARRAASPAAPPAAPSRPGLPDARPCELAPARPAGSRWAPGVSCPTPQPEVRAAAGPPGRMREAGASGWVPAGPRTSGHRRKAGLQAGAAGRDAWGRGSTRLRGARGREARRGDDPRAAAGAERLPRVHFHLEQARRPPGVTRFPISPPK